VKLFSNDTTPDTTTPEPVAPVPAVDVIALGLLALELDTTVNDLATRLGDEVFTEATGIRCCSQAAARRLIGERDQQVALAAEVRRRNAEKVTAAAQAAQARVPRGIPAVPRLEPALAMRLANGEGTSSARHDRFMDDALSAATTFYTCDPIVTCSRIPSQRCGTSRWSPWQRRLRGATLCLGCPCRCRRDGVAGVRGLTSPGDARNRPSTHHGHPPSRSGFTVTSFSTGRPGAVAIHAIRSATTAGSRASCGFLAATAAGRGSKVPQLVSIAPG
jgi:hypothetical protein